MDLAASERLRSLDEIHIVDPRQESIVLYDEERREVRPRTLKDHRAEIEVIQLWPAVPEAIRIHFETARNLLLYSWYVYRFTPVAEFQALSTVEFALKKMLGAPRRKRRLTFRELLEHAIERGWIQDDRFQHKRKRTSIDHHQELGDVFGIEPSKGPASPQEHVKILVKFLPLLRNELAHGSSYLTFGGYLTLEICADLINQLFDLADSGQQSPWVNPPGEDVS